MDKIYKIKLFNDTIDKLFDYLIETFPLYKSDVSLSKSSIELIRRGNPRLVIQQFIEYVDPYANRLLNCDENFFLNFDKNLNIPKEHVLYGLKFKGIWKSSNISRTQKAIIWLYFQKLYRLGKDIVS
jgi:hypothetical protein